MRGTSPVRGLSIRPLSIVWKTAHVSPPASGSSDGASRRAHGPNHDNMARMTFGFRLGMADGRPSVQEQTAEQGVAGPEPPAAAVGQDFDDRRRRFRMGVCHLSGPCEAASPRAGRRLAAGECGRCALRRGDCEMGECRHRPGRCSSRRHGRRRHSDAGVPGPERGAETRDRTSFRDPPSSLGRARARARHDPKGRTQDGERHLPDAPSEWLGGRRCL